MVSIVYDKETGKKYEIVNSDIGNNEIIVKDINDNKIVLNKRNVICSTLVDDVKEMLKVLFKSGEIGLTHYKYSNSDGTFLETDILLDNESILHETLKF